MFIHLWKIYRLCITDIWNDKLYTLLWYLKSEIVGKICTNIRLFYESVYITVYIDQIFFSDYSKYNFYIFQDINGLCVDTIIVVDSTTFIIFFVIHNQMNIVHDKYN